MYARKKKIDRRKSSRPQNVKILEIYENPKFDGKRRIKEHIGKDKGLESRDTRRWMVYGGTIGVSLRPLLYYERTGKFWVTVPDFQIPGEF